MYRTSSESPYWIQVAWNSIPPNFPFFVDLHSRKRRNSSPTKGSTISIGNLKSHLRNIDFSGARNTSFPGRRGFPDSRPLGPKLHFFLADHVFFDKRIVISYSHSAVFWCQWTAASWWVTVTVYAFMFWIFSDILLQKILYLETIAFGNHSRLLAGIANLCDFCDCYISIISTKRTTCTTVPR